MQIFQSSPQAIVTSIVRHRSLILALAKREILSRYKGSSLGILWSIVTPVFMLCVYTFVFSVVFKARWDVSLDSTSEFAMVLFVGLIVFNIFSECVGRAPSLVTQNANYVKKVIFPLEVLPWVTLISSLFHAAISLAVWLVFYLFLFGIPHPHVLLVPIVLTPLVLLTVGLSWFLASLGTFLRDLSQAVSLLVTVLMFLSPIFYPVSALPERFRLLLIFNPLTLTIEQVRGMLVYGTMPNLLVFTAQLGASSLIAWLCFIWFQKTRRGFADVL